METGDKIWWLRADKTWWNGSERVAGTFIERTAKRVTIEVLRQDGALIRKSVSPDNVIPNNTQIINGRSVGDDEDDTGHAELAAEPEQRAADAPEVLDSFESILPEPFRRERNKLKQERDDLAAKLARAEAALRDVRKIIIPEDRISVDIHGTRRILTIIDEVLAGTGER